MITDKLRDLRSYARDRGFRIRFRNSPTNMGDFCIFLYVGNNKHYQVGYDGIWSAKEDNVTNFDKCLENAYHFIDRWVYQHS